MNVKERLEALSKNCIILQIEDEESYKLGATRFGGKPDTPVDFTWPTYKGKSYDDIEKERPLTFWLSLTVKKYQNMMQIIYYLNMGYYHFSMKLIHNAGDLILRIKAVQEYIGLKIFQNYHRLNFRKKWKMILNSL